MFLDPFATLRVFVLPFAPTAHGHGSGRIELPWHGAPPSSISLPGRGGRPGRGAPVASTLALLVLAAAVAAFLVDVVALAQPGWRGHAQGLLPVVAALALAAALHGAAAVRSPACRAECATATCVALLACLDLLAGTFVADGYTLIAPSLLSACMAVVAAMLVAVSLPGAAGAE